jgi:two-component system, NtrC family, nitrogen regulation sensor histidine kinase NtrY
MAEAPALELESPAMRSAGEQPSGSGQQLGGPGWLVPVTASVGAALTTYLASSAGFPAGLVAAAALVGSLGALLTQAWARQPASAVGQVGRRSAPGSSPAGASDARQRFLAVVADSVPDAVVLFSEVGTIQYSNPVARDLFFEGQIPEGQNFIRLVSAATAPLREALLGDTDRFFSVDVDGRSESYHLSRRTFIVDGEPLTLLVVKYMTREIRRREVEMLQRVVRVISHEVNNSLAPISSLMHSARKLSSLVGQADKFQRIFDTIDERASHLRTFLEGYAALARLPRPRRAEASWAPLLAQVSTLYPDVTLPEPPALPGWFDAAQVEQVLINLLKNAREAGSPAADISVEIRTDETLASELDVLDRGPGFSAEAMQNAVLPLYTTKPGGSGMGLALCREVAEAHGGSLDVCNRNGGGACIRVRLAGRGPRPASDLTHSRLTLTRG